MTSEPIEVKRSGWHSNPTIVECWYFEKTAKNDKRLKRIDVDILGWLLHHANSNTGQCNPGIETIAAYDNISRETVSPSLKRLKQCEYIRWRRTGLSNQYTFNLSVMKTREELFQAAGLIHYSERKAKMSSSDDIGCHHLSGQMSSSDDIGCHHLMTQTTKLTTKRTTKRTTCEEKGLRPQSLASLSDDDQEIAALFSPNASIDVLSPPDTSIDVSSSPASDEVRPNEKGGCSTSRQAVTRAAPTQNEAAAAFGQVCLLHPGYQEDYRGPCAKKFAALVKAGAAPGDVVRAAEFANETHCTTYLFNWLTKGDWKKHAAPYGGQTLEEIVQHQYQSTREAYMKSAAELRASAEEWLPELEELRRLSEPEELQQLFSQ